MADENEEKAKANDLREKAQRAAECVAGVLVEAQKVGMEVTIGQIGIDNFGRMMPVQVTIKKVLA